MHMTTIGILGAAGRMGQAIAEASAQAEVKVAGGVDRPGVSTLIAGHPIGTDVTALAQMSDVLIDFSSPVALAAHLEAAKACGRAVVIGTTGGTGGDGGGQFPVGNADTHAALNEGGWGAGAGDGQ